MRTIRQLSRVGSDDGDLVHKIQYTSHRGYNGTDYHTYCGLDLTTGQQWATPRYETVTCVRCLGTPKKCVGCKEVLCDPRFPSDTPERCIVC